jgi:hypothetical protein
MTHLSAAEAIPVKPAAFVCHRCGAPYDHKPGTRSIRCQDCGRLTRLPGAANVNGFGTTYYGERDYREDGSYVTTEWVVAFFLPLYPVRSHRLRPVEASDICIPGLYQHESYIYYDTTRPHMGQVFLTYLAAFAFTVIWIPAAVVAAVRVEEGPYCINLILIIVAAAFLPMLALAGLRHRSKRRAGCL